MEPPFLFCFFFFFLFHCLTVFVMLPHPVAYSCSPSDLRLIGLAFRQVNGFKPLHPRSGECSLVFPSRNLTGTVSWMYLRNVTAIRVLDLSGNGLHGYIPGGFWSSPALFDVNLAENFLGGALRFGPPGTSASPLRKLNLSGNRFTSAAGLESLPRLEILDLSRNSIALVPLGLNKLRRLERLDVSMNSMRGAFPGDMPPLANGLVDLNVSYNNFTGVLKPDVVKKFGISAFVKAGSLRFPSSPITHSSSPTSLPSQKKQHKQKRRNREIKLGVIIGVASFLGVLAVVALCVVMKKKRKWRKDDKKWEEKEAAAAAATSPPEARWVVGAKMSAPVVLFEKPLMALSFADLAKATSGFGRESLLAEGGRSGPAYRAVFAGDMHVVARVVEAARDAEERAAAAYFRDLARLRHPNLLPLLGYCIPGKEKLALYEYMEKGDLHRWLHELPAGQPNVEDWSSDTWEPHSGEERHEDTAAGSSVAAELGDWPTRHRIALGIARGLAFLHQGWVGSTRGVAHGHLVPSNVLLGDDLEPRVADFGSAAAGGTAEGDVYDFGVVVMELVTGREGWSEEAVGWARGMVRSGRAAEAVDPRIRVASAEEEKEVIECFRVGYLCTAPAAEKRPTMQQVVGLLKDLRPASSSIAGGRAAGTFSARA